MRTHQRIGGIIALATAVASGNAQSAGFALIENSASGMGNAFAGAAAIGEDASTLYFNPAAMTRLTQPQLSAALHYISPKADFTDGGSTAATGGNLSGPDAKGGKSAVVPNLYYAQPISTDLVAGIGLNVPFGLETEYNDDWVGRYQAVRSQVQTVNINPSLAWQASDRLSLGLGFSAQYIDVNLTSAVDLGSVCIAQEGAGELPAGTCSAIGALPQQADGFADLSGDSWSWGYNLGLLFDITGQTRLGLAYRSKVSQDVSGRADFTVPGSLTFLTTTGNFVDTALSASVDLPETLALSLAHEPSDQLTLLFDWTWTRWSRFEELRIDYASAQADSVTTEAWDDSNRFSIGANYRLTPQLTLRAGLALDQSPVPNAERRTPRIPGNDRRWLAVGMGYQFGKRLSLDLGYARLLVSDTEINNTFESSVPTLAHTLKGTYQASVDIASAQLNWNF